MLKYCQFITEGRKPKYENILKFILSTKWNIYSSWKSAAENFCVFFRTDRKDYKFSLIISEKDGILIEDTYNTLYLDTNAHNHVDYEIQPEENPEIIKKLKSELIRNIIEDPTKYKTLNDIPSSILAEIPDDIKNIHNWGLIG